MKGKNVVDQRWFKKFYSGCKNLDDQASSGKPKTMDSKAMLQLSSTQRVSGELSISQSSIVSHLHDLDKSISSCQIVPHITKILQNFLLTHPSKWTEVNNCINKTKMKTIVCSCLDIKSIKLENDSDRTWDLILGDNL